MSSKKRAIVRMEGSKYEKMKKLEKDHIQESGAVRWKDASIAASYVEENVHAMQERQDQYREMVVSFQGDLAYMEEQTENLLLEQEQSFFQQISEIEYEMNLNTAEALTRQTADFEEYMQELQITMHAEIAGLQDELREVSAVKQEKEQAAMRFIEEMDQLFDWIRNTYDWEFFEPGEAIDIERRIDTATENYFMGLTEASISQSQTILHDLIKKRIELEQKVSEWNLLRGMADQRISQLLLVLDENREVAPVDLNMNIIENVPLLDVDHWTRGRYSELEEKLLLAQRLVQDDDCQLTSIELSDWLVKLGETMEEQIAQQIMAARYHALDGQIRRNLASIAADVMTANGFRVVDHTEDIDGIQEPFFVVMRDDHGGEVCVNISPEEGYINQISIEMTESSPVMEYQLENQRNDVIAALNRRGVIVQRLDKESKNFPLSGGQTLSSPSQNEKLPLPSKAHPTREL